MARASCTDATTPSTPPTTTALTNVFTGRPARTLVNRLVREVGPMSNLAPEFPMALAGIAPLLAKVAPERSSDFMPMFAGQAAALGRELPAGELTGRLADEALTRLRRLAAIE